MSGLSSPPNGRAAPQKRVFPPTCQAGPAWSASDAGRTCARAILASADMLIEGGWNEEQVRAFVGGCLDLRFQGTP